jgi:hypothetical protein
MQITIMGLADVLGVILRSVERTFHSEEVWRTSAAKIGATTDAARPIPLGKVACRPPDG